uniref:Predicted protein n=1 Tax=Hordeum vulgare subsp. vulgare TaxID=112509 RepID=F2D4D2_HORVV|nr:predicted protein [Hordeum vulgare subsp. vulgare]
MITDWPALRRGLKPRSVVIPHQVAKFCASFLKQKKKEK